MSIVAHPHRFPRFDPAQNLAAPIAHLAMGHGFHARSVARRSMHAASEGHEACVCDLTEPLDIAQPTVSHHLKVLTEAGFLTRSKRGTWAYDALVPGAPDSVSRLLVTD